MVYEDFIWWDIRGQYTSPIASAIVYKEGDYAVAKVWNEQWGRWSRIAKSTDHASVIQAAIDYVNSMSGGIVLIKAGIYDLASKMISIAKVNNVTIKGEGIGATILKNGGISKNAPTPTYNVVIEDLTIDVNNTPDITAVNLAENSYNFVLRRCELKNTNNKFLLYWSKVDKFLAEGNIFYDGGLIHGADNCAGSQLKTTENVSIFRNNWFIKENSAGGGLLTTGSTGNLLIEGNTFIDLSGNSYAAISIENSYGECKNIQVINNFVYGTSINVGNSGENPINYVEVINNIGVISHIKVVGAKFAIINNNEISDGYAGIYCTSTTRAIISSNIVKNTNAFGSTYIADKGGFYIAYCQMAKVVNNIVIDDAGTTPHGLRASPETTDLYIENNVFRGPFTNEAIYIKEANYVRMVENEINGSVYLGTITTKIIRRNKGYATENSGTATITAGNTSVTVNHGLVDTPSKVHVTPLSDPGTYWYVTNITSTSFDIVLASAPSSDVIFSWYAEV